MQWCSGADRSAIRRGRVRTALFLAVVLTVAPRVGLGAGPGAEPGGTPIVSLSDYTLTNWPEEQGPFPYGVYAIGQDHDGYLWLGTRTGLVRFDGSEFVVWKGSQPLPDDRVSVITTARDGSLWVGFGTVGGVARIAGDRVTLFTSAGGLVEGDVNDIEEDRNGAIWVAAHSGLSVFDGKDWRSVGPGEGLPATPVLSVWFDEQGAMWVTTSQGIHRRDASSSRFTLVEKGAGADIIADRRGQLWVTDPLETFRRFGAPRGGDQRSERRGSGRTMRVDRSGTLWVGTRGTGVVRVPGSADGLQLERLERLTRRQGLISDEVRTIFEDADGTIWLGTRRGLSRLSPSIIRKVESGGGSDGFVTGVVMMPDGALWSGTATGLRRVTAQSTRTFLERDGLPSRSVTALHEDHTGTLWAATTLGIARFDGSKFVAVPGLPGAGSTEYQFRSMASQRDGALWLADLSNGLFRLKDGVAELIVDGKGPRRRAYAIHTDRKDRVWIGYWEGGVSVWDRGGISTYGPDEGLPAGTINAFFEDKAGVMWVATDHTIGRVDGGTVKTFASNGLPQAAVVSMIEDRNGEFWIGLGPSLVRISPREFDLALTDPGYQLRYHAYAAEDGLPGTLGRPGMPSAAGGEDGRLWFVTSEGLAVVDPMRLHERPAPRAIRVSTVFSDGQALTVHEDGVDVPARTNRLAIRYSLLNLATSNARFRHRLQGFDDGWQYVGGQREVSYTNLRPGRYQFRVASQHDGAWLEAGAPLHITILPAFYQTWTFYAGAATLAAFSLWFGWRRREFHIKRGFDLVLAERTRVGREIHDTLLQSLVAVALEFDDISEQLEPANSSLKQQVVNIRKRVEEYILEARQSISNLRSPMLVQSDLVTALKRAGESAGVHGLRFELSVQGMARRLDPQLEEQLLRIGSEAVSNAVRHSGASAIHMELCFDHAAVTLRVSDDGRGFDPGQPAVSATGTHWGIAGMRERAERVGAQLRLVSHPGAGTTVEAIVPQPQLH